MSTRLKGFDYSNDNLYFVTTLVKKKLCCFGKIVPTSRDSSRQSVDQDHPFPKFQMILNDFGKIVESQWLWLAEQYPYVVLHEFVVMPNHLHGIIEINRRNVVTGRDPSQLSSDQIKIKSLSDLMGAFKTTSSKKIHLAGFEEFAWWDSFHDHIIRDEKSYRRISNYIKRNPGNWYRDKQFDLERYSL
jgi:putative transposase